MSLTAQSTPSKNFWDDAQTKVVAIETSLAFGDSILTLEIQRKSMAPKRSHGEMSGKSTDPGASSSSPFMPMFEHFRAELDEHHDRRERIIKASRDVTAASKKMYEIQHLPRRYA